MTIGVETQVRIHFQDFERSLPTFTADEITEAGVGAKPLRATTPPNGTSARDRMAVFATAFLVVLAAIGGVSWLIGSWGGGDTGNAPATPSSTPTIAGLSDTNLSWIESETPFPGGAISSQADGVLVSNQETATGGRTVFSVDGRKWVQVPLPPGDTIGGAVLVAGVWVSTGQLPDLPTEAVYVSNNHGATWNQLLAPDSERMFSLPGNRGFGYTAVHEGSGVAAQINFIDHDPWAAGILEGAPAEICDRVVTNNEVTYELAIDDYTICLDDARSGPSSRSISISSHDSNWTWPLYRRTLNRGCSPEASTTQKWCQEPRSRVPSRR